MKYKKSSTYVQKIIHKEIEFLIFVSQRGTSLQFIRSAHNPIFLWAI